MRANLAFHRSPPVPRREIFDLYWYFASERQRIFERRYLGFDSPWSQDPILRAYKFCNVFRAADRVSQYLIREIACQDSAVSPADRLFQIVAFRTFSRIETWEAIRRFLGHDPLLNDLRGGSFREAVEYARASTGGLYTGAFILCATSAYGHSLKHLNHIALWQHMFLQNTLAQQLLEAGSLQHVYDLLHAYPLMGDFMSYQVAIDLNYSDLLGFSENDFTQPGPGAVRGIRKVFLSLGDYSPAESIQWMVEQQAREFERLGLRFGGLWGRPLHAIDCQGLFCEVDKYCRVAVPDLASSRKRIKTKFRMSKSAIQYFFPPKWGIHQPSVEATLTLAV